MSNDLRTRPDMGTTHRADAGNARTMTIVAFVCAAVGLFIAGFILGAIAIVLGVMAYRRGDRLGLWAAVAGAVVIVLGIVGVAILASMRGDNTA